MPRFRNTSYTAGPRGRVCHRLGHHPLRPEPEPHEGRRRTREDVDSFWRERRRVKVQPREPELTVERAIEKVRRAGAWPSSDRETARRVEILERRLAKLNLALEDRETLIQRLLAEGVTDEGVASIFQDVQGLSPEDAQYQTKRGLMDAIFKANVELQERLQTSAGAAE